MDVIETVLGVELGSAVPRYLYRTTTPLLTSGMCRWQRWRSLIADVLVVAKVFFFEILSLRDSLRTDPRHRTFAFM